MVVYVTFVTIVIIYNISFYFVQRHMNFGISGQIGWKKLTNVNIKNNNNLEECIIFGFPDNDNNTGVLNHCILLAKYHIYIQKLKGNDNIDMYVYLAYLKQQLSIEK